MILLVGGIGWGLLTIGAITHIWHQTRLRELLVAHTDHERAAAAALTAVEVGLAISLPIALASRGVALAVLSVAATVVGLGFVAWIARLLASGSSLPCACSFSSGPTSRWSLARAGAIVATGALAFSDQHSSSVTITTLATALAVAAALFVVPEAMQWPAATRAQLARLDAYAPDLTPASRLES